MATDKELQSALNSGGITSIFLGDTTSDEKVVTSSEVDTKIAAISIDGLTDTPSTKIGSEKARVVVSDDGASIEYLSAAYGSWETGDTITLTNAYQLASSFTSMVTAKNITLASGVFTAVVSGVYTWALERIYQNEDTNPVSPISVYVDVRKNGISYLERSVIIGAATASDEPSIVSFTSPFIIEAEADDYFEFYFKAEEGAISPANTYLTRLQLTADKIH